MTHQPNCATCDKLRAVYYSNGTCKAHQYHDCPHCCHGHPNPQPTEDRHEREARELVGKWGYEERYWWEPIAQALRRAEREGAERVVRAVGKSCVNECRDPDGGKCAESFKQEGKVCICFCHRAVDAARRAAETT